MYVQFRYQHVISVCGLEPDLREFANGDNTEVSFFFNYHYNYTYLYHIEGDVGESG